MFSWGATYDAIGIKGAMILGSLWSTSAVLSRPIIHASDLLICSLGLEYINACAPEQWFNNRTADAVQVRLMQSLFLRRAAQALVPVSWTCYVAGAFIFILYDLRRDRFT